MMMTQMQRFSAFVVLLVTLFLVIIATIQIARTPQAPIFDQGFIGYTFADGYPRLSSGITSLLIAGVVNQAIDPQDVDMTRTNTVMRMLATSLYLVAGGLLAWGLFSRVALNRKRVVGSVLFLLLLFTSRYPLLWLSSELFAGAFLMLYLWSMLTRQNFALRALLLALFAFSKPDLLLPATAVGLYEMISEVDNNGNTVIRPSPIRIATLVAIFALLVLSTILVNGLAADTGVGIRSLISFSQHYAAVVEAHQIVPAPEPWANAQSYIAGTFGPVSSVLDAILAEPSTYMDFVFLSAAKSIRNSITGLILFLLPLAGLYWQSVRPRKLQVVTLLFLTNLLPILLLSFLHVRYMTRFYPLILAIVFAGIFADPANAKVQGWLRYASYGYLALLFIIQLYLSLSIFQEGYWFRD